MVSDRHEDRVIVELAGGTLDRYHIRGLPPKHEDARLNADEGLEGVGMEVETREDVRVLQYPLSNISESRRPKNPIGEDDRRTASPRLQELDATFDEQNLRRL